MFILFDIGGTKMRFACSKDGQSFEAVHVEPTPVADFDLGMSRFEEIVRELAGGTPIKGIIGGIAGALDENKSRLIASPHIRGWVEKPLKKILQTKFNVPVMLENDADLVGLGEAAHGAGRGHLIVSYLTVSTGVGGTRIVDCRIDKNVYGFEPGHQIISLGDSHCPGCGGKGDLESFISGSAIEERLGVHAASIPQDDPVWQELARYLAIGLHNTTLYWSPNIIVVGGSMMTGNPCIPFDVAEMHFKRIMKIFPFLPQLKLAELKDEGGLYGGLVLARELFGSQIS